MAYRLERAGAVVTRLAEVGATLVDWPLDTLRRFMLEEVLLNELGHHVLQHYKGKRPQRIARTRDHEAFAARFADTQMLQIGELATVVSTSLELLLISFQPQPCRHEKKHHQTGNPNLAPLTKISEAAHEVEDLLALHDDVYIEIERLIGRLVVCYVDRSNPVLHADELMAECRAKLARLIHDGRLTRCPTRAKFFAFLKTAFKNHIRSLIQKHVYCFKRAGIKPPQKGAVTDAACDLPRPLKPIRLSLDDPDAGI